MFHWLSVDEQWRNFWDDDLPPGSARESTKAKWKAHPRLLLVGQGSVFEALFLSHGPGAIHSVMYMIDDMISLRTCQSDVERVGSFVNMIKSKGRVGLGFKMFSDLTVLSFNMCYLGEFDAVALAKIWSIAGHLMPVNKSGSSDSKVITRLKNRESSGFLFKKSSPFKPDPSAFKPAEVKGTGTSKARVQSDEERFGLDPFGEIDYLGPPQAPRRALSPQPRASVDPPPPSATAQSATASSATASSATASSLLSESGNTEPSSPPREPASSPMLTNGRGAAGRDDPSPSDVMDVDANPRADQISPGSRDVRYVHGTKIKPSMLTDAILLDESGAYFDDLVDVLFTQTSLASNTEVKTVALSQKLSELDDHGDHRFKPEDLLHMGKSLTFKKSSVSFPITVNTKTETVTGSSGARHAHATNDFHYSAAVYDVERNRLLHADSLSYASHEWVVRNELVQWIFHLRKLESAPEYCKVPCSPQGATMNCGPASIVNNRLIIAALRSPGNSRRINVSWPPMKFKARRVELKAEIMALVENAAGPARR